MDYTVAADRGQVPRESSVEAWGSPLAAVADTALLAGRPEESQTWSWWWIDGFAQTFRNATALERSGDLPPVLHFRGSDISNALQMRDGWRHAD